MKDKKGKCGMNLELGQKVYHIYLYQGREQMEVVGIRKDQVELEGGLFWRNS